MRIRVEVRGSQRDYLSSDEPILDLELPAGVCVGDVVRMLGIPVERSWNAAIRSRLVSDRDPLADGDHLVIFDVIGGG
jgi:molybdopterin converting factor small subunit